MNKFAVPYGVLDPKPYNSQTYRFYETFRSCFSRICDPLGRPGARKTDTSRSPDDPGTIPSMIFWSFLASFYLLKRLTNFILEKSMKKEQKLKNFSLQTPPKIHPKTSQNRSSKTYMFYRRFFDEKNMFSNIEFLKNINFT